MENLGLLKLIKLLFNSKPSECKQIELLSSKYLPFKNFKFMMWCGKIIYRKDKENIVLRYLNTFYGEKSKRHEQFHIKQAKVHGKNSWIFYYLMYIKEWLKGIPFLKPFYHAYYTIPFEVEAYALENNQNSLDNYDQSKLKNSYTLKNRRKTYLDNKDNWKNYVKQL